MRISELSATTGVPVATIKYYLRERLVPEGRRTSATQAQYDQTHVDRLRLVRALLGPGGLSVVAAREVIRHLDTPPDNIHDLLGLAQDVVTPPVGDGVETAAADELLERWGWAIEEKDCRSRAMLAEALSALDQAGFVPPPGALDLYARTMREIADFEIAGVPTGSRAEAVRYVVLGTVLIEPLLLALRRLAEQDASARRFASADPDAGPP